MENYVNGINNEDIFKDIIFNRNEIKGTDETFFNEDNNKDNSDSLDLEESENSVSSDKLDICDNSMEEEINKVKINEDEDEDNLKNKKKMKHRLSKKDLNTIPLPIFECPYCANEKVVFNHLINEEFYLNYLYNAEKKDINLINLLEKNNLLCLLCLENKEKFKKLLKDKINNIDVNKLEIIINFIINNTEYINKYYDINESFNFLKQKRKKEKYNINIINKNLKQTKEKNRIKFDESKKTNKDSSDNDIDDIGKINQITKNIIENENKIQDNNNIKLDENLEEKICDSFNKLLDDDSFMDLSRKIKWSDIEFEDKPYNIWEPNSINDDIVDDDIIESNN